MGSPLLFSSVGVHSPVSLNGRVLAFLCHYEARSDVAISAQVRTRNLPQVLNLREVVETAHGSAHTVKC